MSKETYKEGDGLMLFGVRIDVDPMRKTISMNNLADYQHVDDLEKSAEIENPVGGYVSDNVVRARGRRARKRGTPWSEEEHERFLMGLKKVGKGDWRGISNKFVKTRTPTQVASHAQKYFLRHNTVKHRRRSSLFDITTEMVSGKLTPEQNETNSGDSALSQPHLPAPHSSNTAMYPIEPALPIPIQMPPILVTPVSFTYPLESSIPSQVPQQRMMLIPAPCPVALLPRQAPNSNSPANNSLLSLNLSLSLSNDSPASPNPTLQTMLGFASQDSYISVA